MSHAIAIDVPRAEWRQPLVGVVAIIALYAPIFPPLVHEWATYSRLSHGFAIPIIAAYLVWSRRDSFATTPATPTWWGLPLVVAGLALYAVASLGSELFLVRLSFPVTLAGGVLLLAGTRIVRHVLPGIVYLIFMMPLPYLPLKSLTQYDTLFDATLTAGALPWIGVPVYRQGTLLHLANMTLEVAELCSSIAAIASLLALGGAYGFVRRRSARVTLLLLAAAIPLGFVSNLVRIILTAAGAYYLGPIALHNVVHAWTGTSVFLVTFVALGLLDLAVERIGRGRR